jgi:hypothetical protein
MKQPGPSLAEAVTYVDNYIANYFEVEKTTEQKLAEALVEIAELKAKLAELEVPKPKFKVGQRVTQPHWEDKDAFTVSGIIKDDEGFRYKVKGWGDWINYPEHILVSAD